jgi:hypothetical protein
VAKRRGRAELAVSLFPFLSILACVIGVLTLMIAALALDEMASSSETHPGAIDEVELAQLVGRIEVSSTKLGESLAQRRELTALRHQWQALGFDEDAAPEDLARQIKDRDQLAEIKRRRARIEAEIEALRSAAQALETEIRDSAEASDDAPVQILPRGTGPPLAPYFVECGRGGVRIRKKDGSWSEQWNLDDMIDHGRFKVFLEQVRNRGSSTVIFLIRPDGVDTAERVQHLASTQYVRSGKLAIPGAGEIDFRRYDAASQKPARPGGS